MTYGRTAAQDLRLEGRRLLSKHFYGDGRWGMRTRTPMEQRTWAKWTIVKQRPRRLTWARPSGPLGRKTHAIRYSLTATHTGGDTVRLTVWQCGQHAYSQPIPQSHPPTVCAACMARVTKITEVPYP